MKDETIMDESKILKDSIIDAINRFKHDCEVSTKIEIKVMINI